MVRDRTDRALVAWLRRQVRIDSPRWMSAGDIGRAIDALKAWMSREGRVSWRKCYLKGVRDPADDARSVYETQCRILDVEPREDMEQLTVAALNLEIARLGAAMRSRTP